MNFPQKRVGKNIEACELKDKIIRSLFDGGKYEVSESGVVTIPATGKVLSQHKNRGGFFVVTLFYQGVRKLVSVHRLVALRHLPAPPRYMEVDHINGEKTDNRSSNLAWVDRQENVRLDFVAGRCNIGASGELHNNAKLTDREALALVRLAAKNKLSYPELAECFDISLETVHAIISARIRKTL